jgi:hypothetical protein
VTVPVSGRDRQPEPLFEGERGEEDAAARAEVRDHGRRLPVTGEKGLPRGKVLGPVDVAGGHRRELLGRDPGEDLVAVEQLEAMNQIAEDLPLAPDSARRP